MMDEETDYMIPIFIPQLRSPINNPTEFQSQLPSNSCTEDANRNHLESSGFYLHLSFNENRGNSRASSYQLASQSTEEESRRCQEQLDISRQTLSRLEAEVAQLERVNEGLRTDSEFRELLNLEQAMKRFEQELADCRALALQSSQDLSLKITLANVARSKRFEIELALRELQLSICRRKLECATARALDDSAEEDPMPVSNLPEEEERMTKLQTDLEELNQTNLKAIFEVQEAERLNLTRQNDLIRIELEVERQMSMGNSECEARRHNLSEKRQQLERNSSYLVTLNQNIAREKIREIELLQQVVLVEAARKLDQLERNAFGIMATTYTDSNTYH